jgi:heat shock protein HslJ
MKKPSAVWTLVAAAAIAGGCGGGEESGYESGDDAVKTLYVAHFRVDCVGVGPMKCMQVRDTPDGEWRMFYDQIQGFDYEEGYDYELRVRTEKVENPPADASSIRWILEEVVSKTPASSEAGAGAGVIAGEWTLTSFSADVLDTAGADPADALELLGSQGQGVTITFMEDGRVGGSSGCNQYTGTYAIEGGHSLSFGPLAGTRKMCPPPLMDLEKLTLQTLEAVEGVYVRGGSTLELFGADEKLLATFEKKA